MIALLDTSSLRALVRYYLPFDKSGSLLALIKSHYDGGSALVLDRVFAEVRYQAKGIIVTQLPFLTDASKHIKTDSLVPNRAFFGLLENQFCNQAIRKARSISDAEFDVEKTNFLKGADAGLLLHAMSIQARCPIIVSEETASANDGKLFHKIPANCKHASIGCCTLPEFLKDHLKVDLPTLFS